MFDVGGIKFSFEADSKDVLDTLKALRTTLQGAGKDTSALDKEINRLNKDVDQASAHITGLGKNVSGLGTAIGGVAVAAGKLGLVLGGALVAAITAAELVMGTLVKRLGEDLVNSGQRFLAVGIDLEKTFFGLEAAIDSYTRATGDMNISLASIVASTNDLQQATGVSTNEIQQAQLIMLEMAGSTSLTNDQIDKLIERAAEFSVVAKQDFLNVIGAIDNALLGMPQRLTNMGLNVTEAALDLEEGGKTAAVYNKILEGTEFAVGKVSESFNETLFGALQRNEAAWESLSQAIGRAQLEVFAPMEKAIANMSTRFAEASAPMANTIAGFQALGGPVIFFLGQIIQITALLTGARLAMSAFSLVVRSGAFPALTLMATGLKTSLTNLRAFAIGTGAITAGATASATSVGIFAKIAKALGTDLKKNLLFVLKGIARVLPFIGLGFAALDIGLDVFEKATKDSTKELLNSVKAQNAHIKVTERSLENFEELSKKTNKTKEEQNLYNESIEQLNNFLPGSITKLGKMADAYNANTTAIRLQLKFVKRLNESQKLSLGTELQRLRREKKVLEQEVETSTKKLKDEIERQQQKLKLLQQNGEFSFEGKGTIDRIFKAGNVEIEAFNEQLLEDQAAQIKNARDIREIEVALGITKIDISDKVTKRFKKEIEIQEQKLRLLEAEVGFSQRLANIQEQRAKSFEVINDTGAAQASVNSVARRIESLKTEQKETLNLLAERRKLLELQISDVTGQIGGIEQENPEKKELNKILKQLRNDKIILDTEISNTQVRFTESLRNLDVDARALSASLTKSIGEVTKETIKEANTLVHSIGLSYRSELAAFDAETASQIASTKKAQLEQREALVNQMNEGSIEVIKLEQAHQTQLESIREVRDFDRRKKVFDHERELSSIRIRANRQSIDEQIQFQNERLDETNKALGNEETATEEAFGRRRVIERRILGLQKEALEKELQERRDIIKKAGQGDLAGDSTTALLSQATGIEQSKDVKKNVIGRNQLVGDSSLADLKTAADDVKNKLGEVDRALQKAQVSTFEFLAKNPLQLIDQLQFEASRVQTAFQDIDNQLEATRLQFGRLDEASDEAASNFFATQTKSLEAKRNKTASDLQIARGRVLLIEQQIVEGSRTQAGQNKLLKSKEILQRNALRLQIQEADLKRLILELERSASSELQSRKLRIKRVELQQLEREFASKEEIAEKTKEILFIESELILLRAGKNPAAIAEALEKQAEGIEVVRKANRGFFEEYSDGIKEFIRDTDTGFGLARQLAVQTAQFMQQSFSDFFFDVMNDEIQDFDDLLRSVSNTAKRIVADVLGQLATKSLLEGVGDIFGSGDKKSGKSSKGLFGGIGEALGGLFGSGDEEKQDSNSSGQGFGGIPAVIPIPGVGDKCPGIENALEGVTDTASKGFLDIFDGLGESASGFLASAFALVTDTFGFLTQGFGGLLKGVGRGFGSLIAGIGSGFSGLVKGIGGLFSQLFSSGGGGGGGLLGGLLGGLGGLFGGGSLGGLFGGGSAGAGVAGPSLANGGFFSNFGFGGFGFHQGGLAKGSHLNGDKIPSLLEDGEFVMKKRAVEKFGLNHMAKLNEGVLPMKSRNSSSSQEVTVVNLSDPNEIARFLVKNPKAIVNIVSADLSRPGVFRKQVKG